MAGSAFGAPVKTGAVQMVKVQDVEGVATHDGPESCVGGSNHAGEALTGERAGRAIEPRNGSHFRVPTPSKEAEGNTWAPLAQGVRDPARSKTPSMCGSIAHGNREIPDLPATEGVAGRIGKSKDTRR
jgi:hypothetical protein